MPELCRFYGVVVTMFFGTDSASFSLEGDLLAGSLPPKQTKLVVAWAALRRQELEENWYLAQSRGACFRIEPL